MKSILGLGSCFFSSVVGVLLLLPTLACSGKAGKQTEQQALFGANHYTANVSNTSHLYDISTTDGTATLIGDIGFRVNGIASNPLNKGLYGITEGSDSKLIEINRETGLGTLIADITGPASSVAINNSWGGSTIISSIGATGSDYYAQSFIANTSAITKFGAVIQELSAEGQISLAIAEDNNGVPNFDSPLYQGTLLDPTTTAGWFYESGINVPLTIGQKYYILFDGYNNGGATGYSGIGYSTSAPIPGEGIIWSNYGGVGSWDTMSNYPLSLYAEGVPTYSNPAFNSKGELYAYNTDNTLCTINLTTGAATSVSSSGVYGRNYGLAFDNNDVLYLVNGTGGAVYTVDKTTGVGTSVGTISGLPNSMAHRGDFNPTTGKYWGLDNTNYYSTTRNLLVTDVTTFTLNQTIPTLDSMHTLAFGVRAGHLHDQ